MAEDKDKKRIICSFCGQDYTDKPEIAVIEAPGDSGAHICEKCLRKGNQLLQNSIKEEHTESKEVMTPIQIKEFLDKYVIGQEKAKKILSVAVYNHMKLLDHYDNIKNGDVELEKSNVIMCGSSGVGKTYIIRTLARLFNVPYAICDATSLTASGYVGADVESVLQKLLMNANNDIKQAERGIIYIDEIDKKANKQAENMSITRDVSGIDVQQALLKLIEGSIVDVPTKGRRINPEGNTVQIDTSKILFIVGGAFPGIEEIIKKRLNYKNSASIGIKLSSNTEVLSKNVEYNEVIKQVNHDDFKKFGLIPELLGRLPVICPLTDLTEDELCRILTEPKNALIKQYQELMCYDNITLDFDKEAIRAIAQKAKKNHTGARGLRSIMENTLLDIMYIAPDKVKKINQSCIMKIDKECIIDGKEPTLVKQQQKRKVAVE